MGSAVAPQTPPSRAWYGAAICDFLTIPPEAVLGTLFAQAETASVEVEQTNAWGDEIGVLRESLVDVPGSVYLEFSLPRLGRRIDAAVISDGVVFVLEFKQDDRPGWPALEQVWDYALDLKYFHLGSRHAPVVPLVVPSAATNAVAELTPDKDGVYRPVVVGRSDLNDFLKKSASRLGGGPLDPETWAAAPYSPTPTIVEAARALYGRHTVADITRHDAEDLGRTTECLEALLLEARQQRRKSICFVTGVPGSGKTLLGLNLATRHRRQETVDETHAVFLSGNDPLVNVLREALVRDEFARRKQQGERRRKGVIRTEVHPFIQNVRHFRRDGLKDPRPPDEHVAIFDEAQRAWDRRHLENWMARRMHRPGFDRSEPEFLIECMDRHPDWALIVCLVGGGQEINQGEAGISAWLEAVERRFDGWQIHLSPQLTDSEYDAGHAVERARRRGHAAWHDELHLATSVRSFRAENLSRFVKALLDLDAAEARRQMDALRANYPLAVTRSLDRAKQWVREHARGTERYGMLASSKALRLKPHAIDVRVKADPVKWFLDGPTDTRTSWYLEDAASEFDVQGLELDWACVTWDADLRMGGSSWDFKDFRGDKWQNVHNTFRRSYLKNAYRVLLTRARQGMVIFVPPGDAYDHTRAPGYYDATFGYLRDLGIETLP